MLYWLIQSALLGAGGYLAYMEQTQIFQFPKGLPRMVSTLFVASLLALSVVALYSVAGTSCFM